MNEDGISYKSLLIKYVRYIRSVEGVDFITACDSRGQSDEEFTDEEWEALNAISRPN